ncbi:hypothetical protein KSF_091700 [Reticulibacter mediterranei]|uniref:Uncharacterized protein n=1 Tax=Reticulibacter mediterranei TaxID=2778369 RepID=A0A8J3N9A8_9CHLR|nr:hypothetical protein KSF_091700 [Reticulibacter mediterranei]
MNRPGEGDKRKAPTKTPCHHLSLRVMRSFKPEKGKEAHKPEQTIDTEEYLTGQ